MVPARARPGDRFAVAGSQYPAPIQWPDNIDRIEHLAPRDHPKFYCGQRFTVNVTRADMVTTGYSPSVRLLEAAACGTPIITDRWTGIDSVFKPGEEILIVDPTKDVVRIMAELPEQKRHAMAAAARRRVLHSHTALHRAKQLEDYYEEALADGRSSQRREAAEYRRQTIRGIWNRSAWRRQ